MKTVYRLLLLLGLTLSVSLPALFRWGSLSPLAADTPQPEPGTLMTVAGTGKPGYSGDGGPASQAQLKAPFGVAVDAAGNIYIADYADNRVRQISRDGTITTFAGTGKPGWSGDNGPAREARLNGPLFLAFSGEGSLLIAEDSNRVRKVSPDGIITTVAGTGKPGSSGDEGPATQATFNTPHGLAVDSEGNFYVTELSGNRIRKVDRDGVVTTVAGGGVSVGDSGPATEAKLNAPSGVAVDRESNLYFTEILGSRVRKVDLKTGIITTVAGTGVAGYSGDGGPAAAAQFRWPLAVAVDSSGTLFISDLANYRVRKVDKEGMISTVAGIGPAPSPGASGRATETALRAPDGLVVDMAGNLYIANAMVQPFDRLKLDARVVKVYGVAAPGLIAGQPFPQPHE